MRRAAVLLVLAFLALLPASLVIAPSALAHSSVSATAPADGEALEIPPTEVSLTFNQLVTMGPDSLRVISGSGEEMPVAPAVVTPDGQASRAQAAVEGNLADGWYAVQWSAVSADGHTIKGTFTFTVGTVTSPASVSDAALADRPDPAAPFQAAAHVLRGLAYVASMLAVGLLCALWALSSKRAPMPESVLRRVRRSAAVSAVAGLVIAPLLLLNNAIIVNAGSVDGIGLTARLLLQSSTGASLLIRMSALFGLCTAVLLLLERPTRRVGAALVAISGIALFATFAMSGHASVVDASTLASVSTVVHLLAAAIWLGGIPAVALAVWSRRDVSVPATAEAVDRFSKLATVSVILVFIAGAATAWHMFEEPAEVLTTQYGVTLLVKVGLVAIVGLLGAYNHFVLVPRLRSSVSAPAGTSSSGAPAEDQSGSVETPASGESAVPDAVTETPPPADTSSSDGTSPRALQALAGLRATLLAESFALILVAAATAALTSTAAPAAAGSHAQHLGLHGHGTGGGADAALSSALRDLDPKYAIAQLGTGELELSYFPGQVGVENTYTVAAYTRDGDLQALSNVTMTATHERLGLGPIERALTPEEDGSWSVTTRDLGASGTWSIRFDVEFPDGALDFTTVEITITDPDSAAEEGTP